MRFLFCCQRPRSGVKSCSQLFGIFGQLVMKKFFIVVCFLTTIFDFASIMLGLCVAAKISTIPGYVFCGVGALGILALMLSARDAWCRRDAFHRCLRIFWWLAIVMNVLMVFLASGNHIILQRPLTDSVKYDWQDVYNAGYVQLGTIAVLTIFLTAAPIGLSFLWGTFFEDAEDLDEVLNRPRRKAAQAAN